MYHQPMWNIFGCYTEYLQPLWLLWRWARHSTFRGIGNREELLAWWWPCSLASYSI